MVKYMADFQQVIELKTLKDCKIDNDDKCYMGQVQQEAIKWIKERISTCAFSCRGNHQRCKEHKFWMDRFNITEEDLC